MAARDPGSETWKGRGKGVKRTHPSTVLNGLEDSTSNVSSDLMCPVCLDLINEAHMTICGHTFCRLCLKKSIEINRRCPKCTLTIYTCENNIFPNHLVNQQIQKYKNGLDLKNSFERKNKVSAISELKNFISSDLSCISTNDLTEMISTLQERKCQLKAKSEETKLELLKSFLTELNFRKTEQMSRLERQINMISHDIGSVDCSLDNFSERIDLASCSQSNNVPTSNCMTLLDIIESEHGTSSDAILDEKVTSPPEEGFNVPYLNYNNPETNCLAQKKRRMRLHFDELSDYYFTLRVPIVNEINYENNSLDMFSNCMTKFTQYSSMRALATIDAGDRNHASSNIASSIEFDKDSEYFAVAGLTKKIRLFDYGNVIRDAIDVHYPCGEMLCESKISCVSWSSYQKNMLVSSDYDGTVTVWDAFSAQKKQVYQEHQKRCWSVDFNKMDTKLIASGSDDSKVKLWHLDKERSVLSLEAKANVCCVQFNPSSRFHLAFGSADHCVHYYDLRNMKEALKIFKGHKKAVSYVKFISSEDLVSASTDSQLKIWNVNDSHCQESLHGHTNEKNFVGLATDGDYVACGSENNALYIYYKELPKKLFSFRFDQKRLFLDHDQKEEESNEFVSAVCWRKGSDIVAAGNSQGVIKILQMV